MNTTSRQAGRNVITRRNFARLVSSAGVIAATDFPCLTAESSAKFKAAVNRCRKGDLGALFGIEISLAELVTVSALAKAAGDTFTYGLTQRLLASMDDRRK